MINKICMTKRTIQKDQYGNKFLLFQKSQRKMQFQTSASLIKSSKMLILAKVLITKGYGQKYVKSYLNTSSCKLQITSDEFKEYNIKIVKKALVKLENLIEKFTNSLVNSFSEKDLKKISIKMLQYKVFFDPGFQETFSKFIKMSLNLEDVRIYIEQAKALYQKILTLFVKQTQHKNKARKQRKLKSSQKKLQDLDQSQSGQDSSSQSSNTDSSQDSSNLQKQKTEKYQKTKQISNGKGKRVKSKEKSEYPTKYRKILTLTQSKKDLQRQFVARALIAKGFGSYMKMNEFIHESKLSREQHPDIHQNDYKKIFIDVCVKICRYLEFILSKNDNNVKQFSFDEIYNLERVFGCYTYYLIGRQRELFENIVQCVFHIDKQQNIHYSEYWSLYIQLSSLSVKQIEQPQTYVPQPPVLPKIVLPRVQNKTPRPYEFHFEANNAKKISQTLSLYSQSHKKFQQVKKTSTPKGLWYKENQNQVCILCQDDSEVEEEIQPPKAIRPSHTRIGVDQYLLKDQFNQENNFVLSSLIDYSNSLECPNLESDMLNFFILFQKGKKIQDCLNKKYHSQGKKFNIQTVNGAMISILLKSLKLLRKQYEAYPQQLPELAQIAVYELSYMIHTSSYKNCKVQLLNFYKKKALDPKQDMKLSSEQQKAKRIDDAYFLIELCNDTMGRMRFEMKRVGQRRVDLMIAGKDQDNDA